ncbi:MAG TPA: methyltransferase domain-containing protein [Jatrophihabitans sp.]|nr:methyltransferase domain-containing protein [Jatrophihabitans sp.]
MATRLDPPGRKPARRQRPVSSPAPTKKPGATKKSKKAAAAPAQKKAARASRTSASTSAPGSRKASLFFDQYPRFYETSETTATRGRLNLRYEAIFAENRELFQGARVLDIASHDGRWSLAALATGAESVIGIEARPELVENAVETLGHYGYGPDRAQFIAGDVFSTFATTDFDVDVVLCLGFLYHTLRYGELMLGIRKANPRHVIIDTASKIMMRADPAVSVQRDFHDRQRAAARDDLSFGNSVLVGKPNLEAISVIAKSYGYRIEGLSDWDGLLRDNPELVALGDVVDYANHVRTTIRLADTLRTSADARPESAAG